MVRGLLQTDARDCDIIADVKTPADKTITFTLYSHPMKDLKMRWKALVVFAAGSTDATPAEISVVDGEGAPIASGELEFAGTRTPILEGRDLIRVNFHSRFMLTHDLAFDHIYGDSQGFFIPTNANSLTSEGGVPTTVSFKRNLLDLGAQFEMNFWGYGLEGGYKGHSAITPYATMGAGFTLAFGGPADLSLNVPVGLGVKYKVRPRVNVGAEWTMRFTTSDKLDVNNKEAAQLNQPYGIQSVGFKNKDCYSFLMFFLTYDLCPKYRKGNN